MSSSQVPPTSEQQMNVFRLRDKMSVLNAEFLAVIKNYHSEKAHYDFTSTMQSYIEHVAKLKDMYNLEDPSDSVKPPTATKTAPKVVEKPVVKESVAPVVAPAVASSIPPLQRKIIKAVRKNSPVPSDSPVSKPSVFAASSPASTATLPKFGDISAITHETPAPVAKPAEPVQQTARKRAIRGGGVLGGSESIIFKGGDAETATAKRSEVKIPVPLLTFPEPSKDFWTKKPEIIAESGTSLFAFLGKEAPAPPKFSGFAFSKIAEAETEPAKETAFQKKDTPAPFKSLSVFGNKPDTEETTKTETAAPPKVTFPSFGSSGTSSLFSSTTTAPSSTGLSLGGTTAAPASTDSLFGATTTAPASTGFKFGATTTSPASSGSTFGATTAAPASTGFTFGGTTSTPAAGGLTFGSSTSGGLFANLAAKAAENSKKGDDDEEGEYVPPKVETVETVEPDSVLSNKVSVFKYTREGYTKLGVGMMHIKSIEDKFSLLIRAATATGTVWLNASINKAMKATVTDKKGDRIRLTCPTSATDMTTMVVRFGTPEAAKKFTDKIAELTE